MNKLIIFISFILIIVSITSCDEEISLKIKDSDKIYLVVDGYITNDTTNHCIRLTRSTKFFSNDTASAVTDAIVTLNDGTNTITLSENGNSGYYYTPSDYYGIAGRTYTLSINVDDNHYEASSYMPESGFAVDSVYYKHNSDTKWLFYINGRDDADKINYYAFPLLLNGKMITTYSRWESGDDKLINGNYKENIEVQYIDSEEDMYQGEKLSCKNGDIITLCICSITKDFYDYLYAISSETGENNPVISPLPANIKNNISNGALGYFTTFNCTKRTLVISDTN